MRVVRFVRHAFSIVALLPSTLPVALHAQAAAGASVDPLATIEWSFTAASDVTAIVLGPREAGALLVLAKEGVVAIDAATGAQLWAREDLRYVPPANLTLLEPWGHGLLLGEEVLQILDVRTGQTVSSSSVWPAAEVRGFFAVEGSDLALVVAKTGTSNRTLFAVDVDSGEVRWQRDDVFTRDPEFQQVPSGRRRGIMDLTTRTLAGSQPPVMDTDSTAIVYWSEDGPVKVHLGTGAVIWRAEALEGKDVPLRSGGYASIRVVAGVAYVAQENSLHALRADDGRALWARPSGLPGRVMQMAFTDAGVLVRGAKPNGEGALRDDRFVSLVDTETGTSVWSNRSSQFEHTAPFALRGDTVYLATREKLVSVSISDGSAQDVASFRFEDGQAPILVEPRADGVLLLATHNLLLLDRLGAPVYQRAYTPPGTGFFARLGSEFLARPLARTVTVLGERYVHVVAEGEDSSGRESLSLVQVDKEDGSETARVWLSANPRDYEVDSATGMAYLVLGDKQVVAAALR